MLSMIGTMEAVPPTPGTPRAWRSKSATIARKAGSFTAPGSPSKTTIRLVTPLKCSLTKRAETAIGSSGSRLDSSEVSLWTRVAPHSESATRTSTAPPAARGWA